jgi:hypothetical protein
MMAALFLAAAGLASYFGFACLALAMPEHWARVTGQDRDPVPYRRGLRRSAVCLLLLAFAACVMRDGPGFGSLLWVMLDVATALGVALTLAWRKKSPQAAG